MKSPRQRRTEIKQTRAAKRGHREALLAREKEKARAQALRNKVLVNEEKLRPTNSYSTPDFVLRGYYVDTPFHCKDCGTKQIWTATQQKWWYEIARGDVWTTATRCRNCRRRERARKTAAREAHVAGIARRPRSGR